MASIALTPEQTPYYNKLIRLVAEIEKVMATTVNADDANEVNYTLNERVVLLSTCPEIMELASMIYNTCKGVLADEMMINQKLLDSKQNIQRMYIDGKLSKWEGMFIRAERATKDLAKSIDGLITMLSFLKTKNNQNV